MSKNGMPVGWVETDLGTLSSKPQYGWTTKAKSDSGSVKLIRTTDLTRGSIDWGNVPFCTEIPSCLEKYLVYPGDILISRAGSVGFSALIGECPKSVFASYLIRFRFDQQIDSHYIAYYLKSPRYWNSIHDAAAGIALLNVNAKKLAAIPLNLAPLSEQIRIVAELDKQLSRLDDAVAALKRVQANCKRYRASALKAAVDGRLVPTEASLAKAEGRDYEPASELLKRILKERRAHWEADQLAKLQEKAKAKGKPIPDKLPDSIKHKYNEPAAPDTDDLPELPEGWCWVTMDSLIVSGPQNGLYLPKSAYGMGIPMLRIDDYQNGWSRSSQELQKVSTDSKTTNTYSLCEGDIIINRVNSMTHIGKSMIVEQRNTPSLFESNMMKFKIADSMVKKYIIFYLWSMNGKFHLTKNAKWAVNQASINQQDVGNTVVPLPPNSEQERIVAYVESAIRTATHTTKQTLDTLARASRLRQSILKHAFEGKLVPQDPSDEPASVLLERIRVERDAAKPTKKKRKQKTQKPAQVELKK